ncbi:MAG: Coenzyme F420 hydrogenase/dehydrogenase, beta subunit C-terminal domain [Asgard group archaeon]
MKSSNVMETRELNLCVSCGACLATCPEGAIEMEFRYGQFLPRVDEKKCVYCDLCLNVCPGIDADPLDLCSKKEVIEEDLDGPSLECYIAYARDLGVRKNATSGGTVTALITELIKKDEFHSAFVLSFDTFRGKPARLKSVDKLNIQKIIRSAKSKYVPASIYNIITSLSKDKDGKYIIVGTPCQILAVKKYLKRKNVDEKNILFLGLFCDKTLNFYFIRYIEDIFGMKNERLVRLEYRSKEKWGWPGHSKVHFNSGREMLINPNVRIRAKPYFQLERCLYCTDKLNRLADLSFGDCYIRGEEDFFGKSSIIVRTKKGKQIMKKYSYLFDLKEANIDEIRKSQRLIDKRTNLEFWKIFIRSHNLHNYPQYPVNRLHRLKHTVKFYVSRKCIQWGRDYQPAKIKFFSLLFKFAKYTKAALRFAMASFVIGRLIMKDFFSFHSIKTRMMDRSGRKNIIIMGGNLFNKGAQAMTFSAIDNIRRRFPSKDVYLFSEVGDYRRPREEKANYNFNILPWSLSIKYKILTNHSFQRETFYEPLYEREIDNIKRILTDSYFIVDVSGYRLTSEFGFFTSLSYLLDIMIAKSFSSPYYILTQSIGPFNYHPLSRVILIPITRLYLKYPSKICLREAEAVLRLQKFRRDVEKRYDIVLSSVEYDLYNIYKKPPPLKT